MSKITVTTVAGQTSGSDANKVIIESGDSLEIPSGNLTVSNGTSTLGAVKVNTIAHTGGTNAMTVASDGGVSFTKSLINEVADRTATTSGNTIDFTIPAGTRRITALMRGISTTGGAVVLFQLGTAGGMKTSGYRGEIAGLKHTSTVQSNGFTGLNGFGVDTQHSPDAGDTIHGQYVFTHMGNNIFIGAGNTCRGPDGQEFAHVAAGKVELDAACTTLRLTSTGTGGAGFDAGEITILTEK